MTWEFHAFLLIELTILIFWRHTMAKFDEVAAATKALKAQVEAKFAAIITRIEELKAGGAGATPEQLDALLSDVQSISTTVGTDTDADPSTPA